jgi:hypothetical protein
LYVLNKRIVGITYDYSKGLFGALTLRLLRLRRCALRRQRNP